MLVELRYRNTHVLRQFEHVWEISHRVLWLRRSVKGLKDTFEKNTFPSLHGESLKFTHTVPLSHFFIFLFGKPPCKSMNGFPHSKKYFNLFLTFTIPCSCKHILYIIQKLYLRVKHKIFNSVPLKDYAATETMEAIVRIKYKLEARKARKMTMYNIKDYSFYF